MKHPLSIPNNISGSTQNGHGSGKDSDDSRTKSDRYERTNSSSKPKDHREMNGNYSGSKRRYHSSEVSFIMFISFICGYTITCGCRIEYTL